MRTNMDEFRADALAAAKHMPCAVRQYITHVLNNTLFALEGQAQIAGRTQDIKIVQEKIQDMLRCAEKIREDLMPFCDNRK